MTDYEIYALPQSSLLHLYSRRKSIQLDPEYQRMGDVWTIPKRQLLIDSIINHFDIPKLYFHRLPKSKKNPNLDFAIIDGRQRLESIWRFIDGRIPLSDEFVYLPDPAVKAAGLTYKDFSEKYPMLASQFDSTSLSVMVVNSDDLDFIEEMFSRLNEAVPLNAAERRNAYGGPLPRIIREVANDKFFKNKISVSNRRYQHRDITAKLLYLEFEDGVIDLKKAYLDDFVKINRGKKLQDFSSERAGVREILKKMANTFVDRDELLKSPGMVILYYLLFRNLQQDGSRKAPTRRTLINFNKIRKENRIKAEDDIAAANYELLEFDKMMQTPNDAYAIRERLRILIEYFHGTLPK